MKTYQIQLTVQGPVFIGDNRILRKTEYILNKKEHKAFIPNPKSLIKYLKKVNRLNEFKKYIQKTGHRTVRIDLEGYRKFLDFKEQQYKKAL